jgi:cytochrome c-type biogenesis protein CcmF
MFMASVLIGCLALWIWRWSRGELASENQLDGLLSRESMFVLNNWIFVGIAVTVLWGSYSPVFSEIFTGDKITLGAQYFHAVSVPLFGAMYLLMGIAPLVAWKKASIGMVGRAALISVVLMAVTLVILFIAGTRDGLALFSYGLICFAGYTTLVEYWRGVHARTKRGESAGVALLKLFSRNRQRYGGYLIHLGIVVIGLGVIASTLFQQQTTETIKQGERITVGRMSMQYDEAFMADADDGREMIIANVSVYRDGELVASIRPRKDFFQQNSRDTMPMTIAGQYSTLESDFYVLLTDFSSDRLTFHVYLNPLVNLVWWGGIILIIGTLVAMWPTTQAQTVAARYTAPQLQTAGD